MRNIILTEEHIAVLSRAVREIYEELFEKGKVKEQPTLKDVREKIRVYMENASAHEDKSIARRLSRNNIEATKCRMMAHMYIGQLGDRIEIYMRFNDEAKTLVTVIFEPANSTHSSHVDVVPCQYTAMEIKKLKRDGHL